MSSYFFNYFDLKIEYKIVYKNVKNINLRINKNNEVIVSSSPHVAINQIKEFVESKCEWITKHMASRNELIKTQPDKTIYKGKKVYFLGSEYEINIFTSNTDKVEFDNENIVISTKYPNDEVYLKALYLYFLKQNAEKVFKDILDNSYKLIENYGIEYPEFYIRNMRSRWGSCAVYNHRICLNLQLIKARRECIQHVVLHELVHFKCSGHDKNFYYLLSEILPQWKQLKNELETNYKDGI